MYPCLSHTLRFLLALILCAAPLWAHGGDSLEVAILDRDPQGVIRVLEDPSMIMDEHIDLASMYYLSLAVNKEVVRRQTYSGVATARGLAPYHQLTLFECFTTYLTGTPRAEDEGSYLPVITLLADHHFALSEEVVDMLRRERDQRVVDIRRTLVAVQAHIRDTSTACLTAQDMIGDIAHEVSAYLLTPLAPPWHTALVADEFSYLDRFLYTLASMGS